MTSPAQNPHFYPPKYDQHRSSYIAPPLMSLPPSSPYYDPHASARLPEMALPEDRPTSEKTVMVSSCKDVKNLYQAISKKQEDYQACQGPYIGNLENEDFFEWRPQRVKRLEIEGQFLELALKVKKLHGQRAPGVIFLIEKICDIAPTIIAAMDVDVTHLGHCLEKSSSSQLKEEHDSLVKRVKLLAAMEKIFGRSEFTLRSGRVCSFPSGVTMLKFKVNALEHKLPDSAAAQGLKSFLGGVAAVFTPAPKDTSAADREFDMKFRYYQNSSPSTISKNHRAMEKVIGDQLTTNRIYEGWRRNLNMASHGTPW